MNHFSKYLPAFPRKHHYLRVSFPSNLGRNLNKIISTTNLNSDTSNSVFILILGELIIQHYHQDFNMNPTPSVKHFPSPFD